MQLGEAVPPGLADMAPGPELAALLSTLDPAQVPNDDIVEVMIARSRQLAHDQAALWQTVTEVLHRRPFAGPLEIRRGEFPEHYASDEVRAALAWTRRAADRETDLAYVVVTHLPLVLQALSRGDIDRPKAVVFARHLVDITPAQVERICRTLLPLAGRLTTGQIGHRLLRLVREIDPDHLDRRYHKAIHEREVVCYLDRDGTATLSARGLPPEQAAAAVARVTALARAARRAGHPHTLDQLRADIVLGLLDGTLHGLTRDRIIQTLLTGSAADPASADQRTGIEIRVPLTTLLGLDDRAGEIPGLGHVPAHSARAAVARQRRAQWRWVVVDAGGRLLTEGLTRRRPGHLTRTGPRGGIVEIQIPEAGLDQLATDPERCGPWAGVVADIAAQHRRHRENPHARLRDLDTHPRDRFPRAALRRHVQVRDRTCVHPGCRASACSSDQDHTLDHGTGGTTTSDDLGPLCRHDHMLKTEGGWQLQQPEPGVFVWTSPLGRTYRVNPEPILPPPMEPVPEQSPTEADEDRAPPVPDTDPDGDGPSPM